MLIVFYLCMIENLYMNKKYFYLCVYVCEI